MMKFMIRCSALLVAGILDATADWTTNGEVEQSLNGTWQFTTNAVFAAGEEGEWDKIDVPGNWDVLPQYAKHRGKGWYRRSFVIPSEWQGRRIRLYFDAVYQHARVTLNGKELGEHIGGYTPFDFDLTERVKCGETNVLVVEADNTYRRGAWWAWGGISRSVRLVANHDIRLVWQHIRSEPDLDKQTANVFVRFKLTNSAATSSKVTISSVIRGVASKPWQSVVQIGPHSETIVEAVAKVGNEDLRLWHFDHPNLYWLDTQINSTKGVVHRKSNRFGIRKVEITADGLWLNGERIRVPGFNRVSDSNQYGNTEPDELVKQDVDLMKRAGAVFSRLMHSPQAPNLLDYLDEKGMMIFTEIPLWGGGDPQMYPDSPLAMQWMTEMIERDYNHPCIVGWSTGNELQGNYDYVKFINEFVRKKLDPHRAVTYVSNTAFNEGQNSKNDGVTFSDLAMINVYGKPEHGFAGAAAYVRSQWPDKPVFFSEFGSRQFGNSLDARIPDLEKIWQQIAKDPYVIGGSLWTFNDYRSHYEGTPASGNRAWGVVDVDRRPKAAYAQVRKLFSPVHALKIEGNELIVEPRSPKDIPSYTLRGYRIHWQRMDEAGQTSFEGRLELPEIKPGDAAWRARVPGSGDRIRVELVTPTGYDVDDAVSVP